MAIGEANAEKRGFRESFSAYVSWLIERDAKGDVKREIVGRVEERPAEPTKPDTNDGNDDDGLQKGAQK